MKWKNNKVYADGVYLFDKEKQSGNVNLVLFGTPSSYYPNMIYFCKLWDNNGKPVRDFVPVIAPNGKACMFNKVPDEEDKKLKLYCDANNGTFKTNKDEE